MVLMYLCILYKEFLEKSPNYKANGRNIVKDDLWKKKFILLFMDKNIIVLFYSL